MVTHKFKFKEKVRLLNLLLANEVNERIDVAYNHHGKSADWVSVKVKLQRIQMGSLKAETTIPELLIEIDGIFNNARLINRAIHPKEVNNPGLIAALKHGVTNIETAYNLNINFGQSTTNKPNLQEVTSLALYKLFMRSVEYLALANYKSIKLDIDVTEDNLLFSAKGSHKKGKQSDAEKLNNTLELVKAGIVWQKVVVLENTNWKNCFFFSFGLTESTI